MSNPGKTEIINMALGLVGVKSIIGDGDTSNRAQRAEQYYEIERDALISGYPWRFAAARDFVSKLPEAPAFDWSAKFHRPGDCLRIRFIHDLENEDWTLEGRYILANSDGPLKVRYTRNDVAEGEFDPLFSKMLSISLALMMISPVGKGSISQQRADLLALFEDAEHRAERADAFEFPPEKNRDASPYPGVLV